MEESLEKNCEEFLIYTDGGCSGNPGPGGWGVVIVENSCKKETQLSNGEKSTTNNRMELSAAIAALEFVQNKIETIEAKKAFVKIFTDSLYLKNGICVWIQNWKKNNWKTSQKKSVLNQDLWSRLDELNQKILPEWNWIKGHSGNYYNELCDSLCKKQIEKFKSD